MVFNYRLINVFIVGIITITYKFEGLQWHLMKQEKYGLMEIL